MPLFSASEEQAETEAIQDPQVTVSLQVTNQAEEQAVAAE